MCNGIGKGAVMAIVITDGLHYIKYNEHGGTRTTQKIDNAFQFESASDAINAMHKAQSKTKYYYVYDTATQRIVWRWMSQEEVERLKAEKRSRNEIKRTANGKIKRKTYSPDVKRLLYMNAGGKCALCGRELLYEDATIDHIIPLACGGADSVENLQICCVEDNRFKGAILPQKFNERITEIFMYQMEIKHRNKFKWKVIHRILEGML